MNRKSVYFIILNYNTAKETQGCIHSIKELNNYGYMKKIVLIDNCSTDNSFRVLSDIYHDCEDIEIYKMNENIGFSKANNFGFNIVKMKDDVEFVIVCNSDIEFIQKDFLEHIRKEFEKSSFFICGPDVFCKSRLKTKYRGHQSPAYPYEWNKLYVKSYYQYNKIKLDKLKGVKVPFFQMLYINTKWAIIRGIIYVALVTIYRSYRENRHENLPIHGSCIILSKFFVDNEKILFYPETKFYWEELLLYLRVKKNNYKVVYNPVIKVNHLQGRATANTKKGELFRNENLVIGAKMYLDELQKILDMNKK